MQIYVTFRSRQNLVLLLYDTQVASVAVLLLCYYAIFIHGLVSNDSNKGMHCFAYGTN